MPLAPNNSWENVIWFVVSSLATLYPSEENQEKFLYFGGTASVVNNKLINFVLLCSTHWTLKVGGLF
jgi:hypothetical protein